MQHLLDSIVAAAGAHPALTLALMGLVAFAESLAIVGTVVPAAVVMFAGGVLVGQGVLGLGAVLAVAVVGAVAGDAFSFELGRRHGPLVCAWPLYLRYGGAVRRAESFVQRHGAASIVLARFAGAVRAFVPLLAGLGRLSRPRFYLANVGSALLWAPVHLLPGIVFGGSLQLAEAVSGRLATMVLLLAALAATATWLVTRGLRWLVPVLHRARLQALQWATMHPGRRAGFAVRLLDPARAGSGALLLGTVVLVGAGWAFLGMLEDVVQGDPLVQADRAANAFFQGLRTASMDPVMIVVTEMGGAPVLLAVIAVTAGWLLWRRARRTLAYWVVSVAVAELLVKALKLSLGRHRPNALYDGVESFSFPSGHATMGTVVLGFLAFLLARQTSGWRRSLVLALAASDVTLVALSRLYLGAHWMSDVLAGMSLGLAWVAFCAMVYVHRGVDEPLQARRLAVLVAITVAGSTALWHRERGSADASFYAMRTVVPRLLADRAPPWGGWPGVPSQRREFAGDLEERFGLQWACRRDRIERVLPAAGWKPAPAWNWRTALSMLDATPALQDLPVLPRFDRGRPSALSFVRAGGDGQRRVLRLWRSALELPSARRPVPIWYGAIYDERKERLVLIGGWMRLVAVRTNPTDLLHALGVSAEAARARVQPSVLTLECR